MAEAAPHDLTAPQASFIAWRRRHALPPGARCFNCGNVLQGPWCHACGQLGEDYHRSVLHLAWEALEGLFHADGRLWHTLPRLLTRPASLTRDYLAGKRASQVPPLRMFLVVLFVLFLTGEALSRGHVMSVSPGQINQFSTSNLSPEDRAELSHLSVHLGTRWDSAMSDWVRIHAARSMAHPDAALAAAGQYAHNLAFLFLPVSGLILSLIFAGRRGFVVFDHLIFSMHSLSFLGLLIVSMMLVAQVAPADGPAPLLMLAAPAHLFAHMRGVYRTGVFGTLWRMGVLFLLSAIVFALMVAGLILVGMQAAPA